MKLPRIPGIGRWDQDPAWARIYDWTVSNDRLGALVWRVGTGTSVKRLHRAAAEISLLPPGSAVLDIPCGSGVALSGLKRGQGVRYIGADISDRMLERTREVAIDLGVADQVETVNADVHKLAYADGEFDLVLSLTGLHCFPDPAQAFRELVRVTKAGGALSGSTLIRDKSLHSRWVHFVGRQAQVLGPGVTDPELRKWFADSGLTEVTIEQAGGLCYFRGVKP